MNAATQHTCLCSGQRLCISFFRLLFICLLITGNAIWFTCTAQKVANWPLNGTVTGTGTANNTVGNITAGSAIAITAFNGSDFYGQDGWPGGALATTAYLQFTIKPNAGYQLDLTSVAMKLRRSTTGSPSGSGPTSWALRSSLDGFTSNLATGSLTTSYNTFIANLSGFYFLTGTVTFRLYGYNVAVTSGGLNRLVAENIYITGLVVLPAHFTSFNAQYLAGDKVQTQWRAENIEAGTRFTIQRSTDGVGFDDVWYKEIFTATGTDTGVYTDRSLPANAAKLYYRIKATQPDGANIYSSITMVSRTAATSLIHKIMVEGAAVKVVVQSAKIQRCSIAVISTDGRLLQRQVFVLQPGSNTLSLQQQSWVHGVYVLHVQTEDEVRSKQFVY